MATFNIPYTFVTGTTIIADEHNDNWVGIKAFAEGISAGTNLDGNAVTTTKIADSAVTTVKLADSAATTAKIADLNVTTAKIADSGVTTAKINASAVTEAKIADGAVTSAKILDGTIVNADVNASAGITYSKLALTNSIVNADINASAAIAYSKLNLAGQLLIGDFGAAAKPTIICTSTTRPTTGVVAGQLIYETDKGRVYVATSTTPTWQLLAGELACTGTRTSGGQAIANTTTATLTYTAEADPDGMLNTSTGVFTASQTGTYACTINVTSGSDMSAGFGSVITLSGEGWSARLLGNEYTISFIAQMDASQTQTWTIQNATGASVTYSFTAQFRFIGQ